MSVVVADSGPLIALARLECLHLPVSLWGRVQVPQTVLDECIGVARKAGADLVREAVADGRIECVPDAPLDAEILAYGLDPGESQAIAPARRSDAVLLIDERLGRRTATMLEIPHLGTCGLLVHAKRAGLVPRVRPLLDRLMVADYFLAPALIHDALRLAGES